MDKISDEIDDKALSSTPVKSDLANVGHVYPFLPPSIVFLGR